MDNWIVSLKLVIVYVFILKFLLRIVVGEECRKSGGTWLITRKGIERLFGKEEER